MSLRQRIAQHANTFAEAVLREIQSSSLEDLLVTDRTVSSILGASVAALPAKRGPGRPKGTTNARKPAVRIRRSPEQIAAVMGSIITLLKGTPGGLRSEQIQAQLKLTKEEIVKPLIDALASKQLTKKGERRATTYFYGAKKTAAKAPAKKAPAKKAAPKAAAKKKTAKKPAKKAPALPAAPTQEMAATGT